MPASFPTQLVALPAWLPSRGHHHVAIPSGDVHMLVGVDLVDVPEDPDDCWDPFHFYCSPATREKMREAAGHWTVVCYWAGAGADERLECDVVAVPREMSDVAAKVNAALHASTR